MRRVRASERTIANLVISTQALDYIEEIPELIGVEWKLLNQKNIHARAARGVTRAFFKESIT
jgi:hypothetical protein